MKYGFKELIVFQKAYKLSMEIYSLSKAFPREETYSLTDQIRRASRSICVNIGEGYGKRVYTKHFVSKMTDADGERHETLVWLDYSKDCKYIDEVKYSELVIGYEEVGKLLWYYI